MTGNDQMPPDYITDSQRLIHAFHPDTTQAEVDAFVAAADLGMIERIMKRGDDLSVFVATAVKRHAESYPPELAKLAGRVLAIDKRT